MLLVLVEEREGRTGCWTPESKGPLGRPRFIWEDNIKTDLENI